MRIIVNNSKNWRQTAICPNCKSTVEIEESDLGIATLPTLGGTDDRVSVECIVCDYVFGAGSNVPAYIKNKVLDDPDPKRFYRT